MAQHRQHAQDGLLHEEENFMAAVLQNYSDLLTIFEFFSEPCGVNDFVLHLK